MSTAAKHLETVLVAAGKWLRLEKVKFLDRRGKERVWERVARTTRPPDTRFDCVGIFTLLQRSDEENKVVFVRQYRPPVESYTIEFPAGLVDPGETLAEAAVRELREETGFRGQVLGDSPPVSLDAGLSNTLMALMTAVVDGDDPVNAEAEKTEEIEGEDTEVILVGVGDLAEKLKEFSARGDIVDSRVWAFVNGLQWAAKINETKK